MYLVEAINSTVVVTGIAVKRLRATFEEYVGRERAGSKTPLRWIVYGMIVLWTFGVVTMSS